MMKTLKIAMMSVMALFSTFVFAQQRELSGKVSDSDGLPLPGVSVVVVGTSNGVQTDFDGMFRIDVALGDVLRFSYLGQKTKDVTIGNFDFLDVILQHEEGLGDFFCIMFQLAIQFETFF